MNKNTLIVYGTKYGSVEKCARILSQRLEGEVEIKNLKDAGEIDLSKYDSVIIGGSIYMGRIQKEVSGFCSKNIKALTEKKVGLFICCMNKENEQAQINNSFPQELLSSVIVKESFGGEFNLKKMNFFERFITKMVSKKDGNLPKTNENKDVTTISMNSIDKFVQAML